MITSNDIAVLCWLLLPYVVCPSVCMSRCLSYSRTRLKPLDGMRCYLSRTLMWYCVRLGSRFVTKKRLGVGTPVKTCKYRPNSYIAPTADCSLQELSNALYNSPLWGSSCPPAATPLRVFLAQPPPSSHQMPGISTAVYSRLFSAGQSWQRLINLHQNKNVNLTQVDGKGQNSSSRRFATPKAIDKN